MTNNVRTQKRKEAMASLAGGACRAGTGNFSTKL